MGKKEVEIALLKAKGLLDRFRLWVPPSRPNEMRRKVRAASGTLSYGPGVGVQ